MQEKLLLNEKFALAKLPEICAPRADLMKLFNQAVNKRVIYVTAPPGFGKTISTILWLSETARETIWLTLDEFDNVPSVFYKQFCTGIVSVQLENQGMMEILKSPTFSSAPVEHTIRLLSEFWPENRQFTLVFDDMHFVTNQEIHKSGLLIMKRLPLCFQTVIISRNHLAQQYASMIDVNKCATISADDLAFSADEIQDYFLKHGRILSRREAHEIEKQTDGWVIGIDALVKSRQIRISKDGSHILSDYIEQQIWSQWDSSLQDFLLKTSFVDEMHITLCECLTGREDCQDVLDKLCESNAFTIKLPDDTYRYHHLFLDFLRGKWETIGQDVIERQNRIAAEYYAEQGEYLKARPYAARSGDAEILMKVVYNLSQYRIVSLDEFIYYANMFNAPSESICDKIPIIYPTLVWDNYLRGKASLMEYYLDKTYHYLPLYLRDFAQEMEAIMIQLILDHRIPLSEMADRIFGQTLNIPLHDVQQGVSLTQELPFFHRSSRDFSELTDPVKRGKVHKGFEPLVRSMDIIMTQIDSGLYLEQNDIQSALESAEKSLELFSDKTGSELRFCAYSHLAAAQFAAGRAAYEATLDETERFIEKSGAHYLRPNFMAHVTKNQLYNADIQAAEKWLQSYFVSEGERFELYKVYQHFTTARAHIVMGDIERAIRYVKMLQSLAGDFKRTLDLAEATILRAIIEWTTGKEKEGQSLLEEVLVEMQPHNFIRVFADEGASILPIIKRIRVAVDKENYSGPIKPAYLREIYVAAYEHSKRFCGIFAHWNVKPVKLSKQQKRILTLLSHGYKYNDVAKATGLTIHTIKSHASAAYHKLNVRNSMDAIIKARGLGLIE